MNAHDSDPDQALMERAATRLARRPGFLANSFAAAFAGDASINRIVAEFDCSRDVAVRLAMMRTPREEADDFRADIGRIVEVTKIDRSRLVSVVRQAQALKAFDDQETDAGAGMLLAARDVVPDRSDET